MAHVPVDDEAFSTPPVTSREHPLEAAATPSLFFQTYCSRFKSYKNIKKYIERYADINVSDSVQTFKSYRTEDTAEADITKEYVMYRFANPALLSSVNREFYCELYNAMKNPDTRSELLAKMPSGMRAEWNKFLNIMTEEQKNKIVSDMAILLNKNEGSSKAEKLAGLKRKFNGKGFKTPKMVEERSPLKRPRVGNILKSFFVQWHDR